MDLAATTASRRALRGTAWPAAARAFLGSVRSGGHRPGNLLTVGTPDYEPWHLVAHLGDSARAQGDTSLVPTLIRREVLPGAPEHLRHDLRRIEQAGRDSTLLVVAPDAADPELLERVSDARRRGSTVLALVEDDPELTGLAHDALLTGAASPHGAAPFEVVGHLVSLATPLRSLRWTPRLVRGDRRVLTR